MDYRQLQTPAFLVDLPTLKNNCKRMAQSAAKLGVTPDLRTFIADHPALFVVYHVDTHAILLLGHLADPSAAG